ncbi:YqzK family protein [Metabacillus bambusae]|uniref:YqzK family protein n=1 Tax=Metabacillus bambusae TaxID=2795218 RepID=A0ABS3N934_9BACI|nr:YqzK family protein [Metabacillus bambusae]MBO1514693.1 YqzK family protein [Metabacillus bambusae]
MIRWLKTARDMLKVFILFTGFTILFYYAIIWVNLEYQELHRYDQPEGAALKVTNMVNNEEESWFNRLMFFIDNGE